MSEPGTDAPGDGRVTRLAAPGGDVDEVLAELRGLRTDTAAPDFAQRICAVLMRLCRGRAAAVLRNTGDEWERLAVAGESQGPLTEDLAGLAAEHGPRIREQGFGYSQAGRSLVVGVPILGVAEEWTLLIELPARERAQINELVLRARLATDFSGTQVDGFAAPVSGDGIVEMLEAVVQVMREERYGAAALSVVNGIGAITGCDFVALGWSDGNYVTTQAISHLDRFERKTENVRLLEAAFEEALDQEADLHWPDAGRARLVTSAHERFCRALGHESAASLILRRGAAEPEAVVLYVGHIDPGQLDQLRFALHLLLPWLANLKKEDRWLGARVAGWAGDGLAGFLGPEHVWRKAFTILGAALLLYVLLGTWPHELEATAQLRTDSTRLVSAPYDGFFDVVNVTAGDEVEAGAELGRLDVQDLYLQESEVNADIRRYVAEADRARAAGQMADMEIANARTAQAAARLDRVRYLLGQSSIQAPFDGVVVEGERSELLGIPVRQGDQLFRLARVEGLYAVINLPEHDIRFIEDGARGELRLLSQPDQSIPFQVETLIPVARVQGQEGNHFEMKVRLDAAPREWWRPGMAGMARVDAGRRNIAWLLTHRLIDQLRITFWW